MSHAFKLLTKLEEAFKFATVQYTLPKTMADQVRQLRNYFSKDQLDLEEESEELVPHITIFYGLKNEDLPAVREGVRDFGVAGFTIKAKPKIFDNPKNDVLVLPVESACFERLFKRIGNWCGRVPPTFRDYKAHCTIAYLKKKTPFDHISLPSDIIGKTSKLHFNDTQGNSYNIDLR